MIPLVMPRVAIGLLATFVAAVSFRRVAAGSVRRLIAACAVAIGVATVIWAFAPFTLLATSRTVRFQSGDAELGATWYQPRGVDRHGAVVIVHGSGSMTRDVYRAWAEPLLEMGMAVLVYDKRGVGDSKGLYEERRNTSPENIQLLAQDAAAALRAAAAQPNVDRNRIGYFGISQAGWIIPRALQLDSIARFAVLLGGSTVSVGEQNYFDDLAGDDHFGFRDPAMPMDVLETRVLDRSPSGFDPRSDIAQMPVPGLWVFGSLDTSTPGTKSMAVLDSIRAETRRPLHHIRIVGANHVGFIVRGPGRRIPPQFAPGLWDQIADWINKVPLEDGRASRPI